MQKETPRAARSRRHVSATRAASYATSSGESGDRPFATSSGLTMRIPVGFRNVSTNVDLPAPFGPATTISSRSSAPLPGRRLLPLPPDTAISDVSHESNARARSAGQLAAQAYGLRLAQSAPSTPNLQDRSDRRSDPFVGCGRAPV